MELVLNNLQFYVSTFWYIFTFQPVMWPTNFHVEASLVPAGSLCRNEVILVERTVNSYCVNYFVVVTMSKVSEFYLWNLSHVTGSVV
jgi:hypothetical protein